MAIDWITKHQTGSVTKSLGGGCTVTVNYTYMPDQHLEMDVIFSPKGCGRKAAVQFYFIDGKLKHLSKFKKIVFHADGRREGYSSTGLVRLRKHKHEISSASGIKADIYTP